MFILFYFIYIYLIFYIFIFILIFNKIWVQTKLNQLILEYFDLILIYRQKIVNLYETKPNDLNLFFI